VVECELALGSQPIVAIMCSFETNSGQGGIRKVVASPSWFRDTPHYWAEVSFPLAYAVACVEVVSTSSEKAGILYSKPDVIETDAYLLTTVRT